MLFRSLTAILLYGLSVVATPIERRSVDQSTFDNLRFFAQFAAASYCSTNDNVGNTGLIACPPTPPNPTVCQDVESDQAANIGGFTSNALDAMGFVAVDTRRQLIVVSFRGTRDWPNRFADILSLHLTPAIDLCTGCEAGLGFYLSYQFVFSQVLAAVQTQKNTNPNFKVVVTGHSLGAATATLVASQLRNNGIVADLYVYGSPRVGNQALVENIQYQTNLSRGQNFRVSHQNDPVPKVPPTWPLFGFRHIVPEYFLTLPNYIFPTPDSIDVYQEDHDGNIFSSDLIPLSNATIIKSSAPVYANGTKTPASPPAYANSTEIQTNASAYANSPQLRSNATAVVNGTGRAVTRINGTAYVFPFGYFDPHYWYFGNISDCQ